MPWRTKSRRTSCCSTSRISRHLPTISSSATAPATACWTRSPRACSKPRKSDYKKKSRADGKAQVALAGHGLRRRGRAPLARHPPTLRPSAELWSDGKVRALRVQ
ncbi:MAG: hypothetical protein MZV70_17740 [Desulfobacterales bacterium]|nr:hypothetical protein [Desulfobacterales bacterium]